MVVLQVIVIVLLPLVTVIRGDNCNINDRSVNVLEKLAKITKDLSTCSGDKQGVKLIEPVAFYATLTKSLTLAGTQTVIYDKVYTNYGTAYNVKTGTFKAPTSGLYFFTATLMSTSGNPLNNILVKNNNQKLSKFYGNTGVHMGSTSAVIKLDTGDTMSVQHHPGAQSQKTVNDEYCSFAGYLITSLK